MAVEVPPELAGQSSLYTSSDPLIKRYVRSSGSALRRSLRLVSSHWRNAKGQGKPHAHPQTALAELDGARHHRH
jgi:hypothetical protein